MMMKSKKGADLSMNVIIIAAIALLVLVILAVLLFRSGGQVSDGLKCEGVANAKCLAGAPDDGTTWIHNRALDNTCNGNECWIQLNDNN